MRSQRRVGQVAAQRCVLVAGARTARHPRRSASAPTRPRNSRRPDPSRRAEACTTDREAALIALLLADPGQDLPRDLVLSPDLLVDPQEARRDVTQRHRRGRVTDPAAPRSTSRPITPSAAPRRRRAARGRRGRDDQDAGSAPAAKDRHRSPSPVQDVAHHQPPGPSRSVNRSAIRADPSVADQSVARTKPGACRTASTTPLGGGAALGRCNQRLLARQFHPEPRRDPGDRPRRRPAVGNREYVSGKPGHRRARRSSAADTGGRAPRRGTGRARARGHGGRLSAPGTVPDTGARPSRRRPRREAAPRRIRPASRRNPQQPREPAAHHHRSGQPLPRFQATRSILARYGAGPPTPRPCPAPANKQPRRRSAGWHVMLPIHA